MSVYAGQPFLRGYGIGGLFGSAGSVALPLLKSAGRAIGKKLLKEGLEFGVGLASDKLRGRNMENAVKQRLKTAALDTLSSLNIDGASPRQRGRKRKAPRGGRSVGSRGGRNIKKRRKTTVTARGRRKNTSGPRKKDIFA